MKQNIYIYLKKFLPLLVVIFLVLPIGCVNEGPVGGDPSTPGNSDKEALVEMELSIPGGASTRSLTEIQEEAVHTVDVLVFDRNDNFYDWRYGTITTDMSGTTVRVLLLQSNTNDSNDKYKLAVLVNARDVLYSLFSGSDNTATRPGGTDLGGYMGDPYTTVMPLIKASVPSSASNLSSGIPMWGEYKDAVTITHGLNLPQLNLIRSLARIDVGTYQGTIPSGGVDNWNALDNFSLQQVHIYNSSNTYSFSPLRANYNFSSARATSPSVPSGTSKATYSVTDIEKNGSNVGIGITRELYAGESDVIMGGTYGDDNHANRACIVVAGYYKPLDASSFNTELSWYRIDFTGGDSDRTLHSLLRNTNYRVVISAVGGPGQTSAAKALETMGSDITATIQGWAPSGQGSTVVDGQNFLSVDRHDIELDKWEKTNETVKVETSISGGWTAEVTSGNSWLTLQNATAGKVSGQSGSSFRFDVTQYPDSDTEPREAVITVTSGKMKLDVLISQSDADGDFMLRLSHSELVFPGRQWDEASQGWIAPDARNISITWGPTKWDYGIAMTTYTGAGVTGPALPGLLANETSDEPVVEISLDILDETDTRVQEDPFFERSSRLGFTVKNADESETIFKQVLIRQVYYSLIVTGMYDYYFQDRSYEFPVQANCQWVTAIEDNNNILENVSGENGNGNGTFKFAIKSSATVGASATITFSSPENYFPAQTYTIIAQDILPNSYILSPGDNMLIPVSKPYRVWKYDRDLKNLNPNGDLPAGAYSVELLWQDEPELLSTVTLINGNGRHNGQIFIEGTSGKKGNAVIAYKINGTIYWSWHIWVTDYDPETQNKTFKNMSTLDGKSRVFMDRNLGTMKNGTNDDGTTIVAADVYESYGLHYQFGRKDPLIGTSSLTSQAFKAVYPKTGNTPMYTLNRFPIVISPSGLPEDGGPGLGYAINNPNTYMRSTYVNLSWYGQLLEMRDDFWRTDNKGDYDPCPNGWRVPSREYLLGLPILSDVSINNGGIFGTFGFIPTQGNYSVNTSGSPYISSAGFNGYLGTASRISASKAEFYGLRTGNSEASTIAFNATASPNIRCVRDE